MAGYYNTNHKQRKMTANSLIRIAAILGFFAVVLGAFGAHALESQLGPSQVEIFQTGVRYHFYHTIALFMVALLMGRGQSGRSLRVAAWCFLLGIIFFSGSLYLLSTRPMTGLEASWLGPVTPIGGTIFIAGWTSLFIHTFYVSKK